MNRREMIPKRPTSVERAADPLRYDIVSMLKFYHTEYGMPLSVMVEVASEIFQQKRKKELEPMLRKYGKIEMNHDYSDIIGLRFRKLSDVQRFVDDFYEGKLEGIVSLEASQPVYSFGNYINSRY